jgi:hypothetical protein
MRILPHFEERLAESFFTNLDLDLGSRLLAEFKPLLFNGHQKKKLTIEKRIKYFEEKNFFIIIYSIFFSWGGGGLPSRIHGLKI